MSKPPQIVDLATKAIEQLKVPQPVKATLLGIQADVAEAYREGFTLMVQAINRQASALERLQNTLNILIEAVKPELKGQLPAAIRIADDGEEPDLASTLITADPIGAGYTLTGNALAQALGVPATDVSVLTKALGLTEDGDCAVVVRRGKQGDIVNYRPRAIARFRELVANPPSGRSLTRDQRAALKRVAKRLIMMQPSDATTDHG